MLYPLSYGGGRGMLSDVSFDDSLVICTRNRPDEVLGCLDAVRAQSVLPAQVIVVDSSDGAATREIVARAVEYWPDACELDYVATEPPLTHQRDVAIDAARGDIVHFIDDDTRIEPGYVSAIRAAFAADVDNSIVGVGGFITGQGPHRVKRLDVWLGLDSDRQGAVLPSGRNIPVRDEPRGPTEVGWLVGASMSYRRSVLLRERPNRAFPFEGEDVEWSSRLARHGRLVVTPQARLRHLEAQTNRVHGVEQVVNELTTRHARVIAEQSHLSTRAFGRSAWGQLVKYAVSGALTLSRRRLGIAKGTAVALRAIRRAGATADG